MKCRSGKRSFYDYGDAVVYLARVLDRSGEPCGHIYRCPSCGALHISKSVKIVNRPPGKGKRRRRGRPVVAKA
jgi:hypothetical protein